MDYSLLMNRVSICFSSSRQRAFIQPAAVRFIRSEWLALAGPDFRPSRARPSASPAGSSKMPRRSTDATSPVWTPHSTSRSGSGSPPWPPRSPLPGRTPPNPSLRRWLRGFSIKTPSYAATASSFDDYIRLYDLATRPTLALSLTPWLPSSPLPCRGTSSPPTTSRAVAGRRRPWGELGEAAN